MKARLASRESVTGVWRNGRRDGFKIRFRKKCRFESDHPYHAFFASSWPDAQRTSRDPSRHFCRPSVGSLADLSLPLPRHPNRLTSERHIFSLGQDAAASVGKAKRLRALGAPLPVPDTAFNDRVVHVRNCQNLWPDPG